MKLVELLDYTADDQILRLYENNKWMFDVQAKVLRRRMFIIPLNYNVDYISGIVLTNMNGEAFSCIQIYLDKPEDEE